MPNNVQSPFQMNGYKILNFSYKMPKTIAKKLVAQEPEIKYEIIDVCEIDDNRTGKLMLEIIVRIGPSKKAISIAYKLEATFCCDEKNLDEKKFRGMIQLNGLASLITIARGQLTAVTATLGLNPGYVLPLINVYELIKESEN